MGGTDDGAAGCAETVDDAGGEGGFGADYGEIDRERFGERERVGRGVTWGERGDARIAGDGVKPDAGSLRELPDERVLAAAGADDENLQVCLRRSV